MAHEPHAGLPHTAGAGEAADSVGIPWGGRQLSSTGFDEDRGEADPRLSGALELAATGDPQAREAGEPELFEAVRAARLLVPVVAEPASVEENAAGLREDTHVDMAAVTLVSGEGQRALPVFSSLAALAAWDPQARPVPVTSARAAQAAVSEECDLLLVDLAGPHPLVLRSSMMWALATEQPWLPAHQDPAVSAGVGRAVAADERVTAYDLAPGEPRGEGVLGLHLRLRPGLGAEEVRELVAGVGERIAADPELRVRLDGLAVRLS